MFVKPAPGLLVRHPVTRRHIPETGMNVPEDAFWHTLLRHGDVVLAVAPVEGEGTTQPEVPNDHVDVKGAQ